MPFVVVTGVDLLAVGVPSRADFFSSSIASGSIVSSFFLTGGGRDFFPFEPSLAYTEVIKCLALT